MSNPAGHRQSLVLDRCTSVHLAWVFISYITPSDKAREWAAKSPMLTVRNKAIVIEAILVGCLMDNGQDGMFPVSTIWIPNLTSTLENVLCHIEPNP